MKHRYSKPPRFVVVLILGLACSGAHAAVSCSTSATTTAFGVYSPLGAAPLDSSGIVSVTCSIAFPPLVQTVGYSIALSPGSSGSMSVRKMQSGANLLNYNLYTTAAYSQVWGDGSASTGIVSGSMTIGFIFWPTTDTNTHTVFARIPAVQDVAAGSYLDTIVVSVTY